MPLHEGGAPAEHEGAGKISSGGVNGLMIVVLMKSWTRMQANLCRNPPRPRAFPMHPSKLEQRSKQRRRGEAGAGHLRRLRSEAPGRPWWQRATEVQIRAALPSA